MTISRRVFLKGGATAATLAALPSALTIAEETPTQESSEGLRFRRTADQIQVLGQNGIEVNFVVDGKWLKGVGAVSLHGKALRNATECIWPEIAVALIA